MLTRLMVKNGVPSVGFTVLTKILLNDITAPRGVPDRQDFDVSDLALPISSITLGKTCFWVNMYYLMC